MDERKLTYDEAILLLNDGDEIHCIRNGSNLIVGCNHSRESLLKNMKDHEETLELGGETCSSLNHGLVLCDESGYLFIKTNKERIDAFDPIT